MRIAIALALLSVAAASFAAAQTYKCRDAAGSLTYSNQTCEKQGLQDAGPVRDRLTTMPTPKAAKAKPAAKEAETKKETAKER